MFCPFAYNRSSSPVCYQIAECMSMVISCASAGRAKGQTGIPSIVYPRMERTCTECGGCNWTGTQSAKPCTVFLLAAAVSVEFVRISCNEPGCSGSLEVDGLEVGVVRTSKGGAEFAFGHEVLWDWSFKLGAGGVSWFGHWRETLARYSDSREQQSQWLFGLRDLYQQTTLDFIQLQQIDFQGAFSCSCQAGITCDGISLAYHQSQAFIVSPAAHRTGSEQLRLVTGSKFQDRNFVEEPAHRRQLLQYARTGALSVLCIMALQILLYGAFMARQGSHDVIWAGLAVEDHEELLASLEDLPEERSESLLSPLLRRFVSQEEVRKPCGFLREILRIIATTAPACSLVKAATYELCEKITRGETLPALQFVKLSATSPHLGRFVRSLNKLGSEEKAECLRLLQSLMQVTVFVAAFKNNALQLEQL